MKLNKSLVAGLVCASGLLSSGVVLAATQTVNNSNFSISYDDGTSFGSLTLSGNAISFDFTDPLAPDTWIAQSVDGAGLVTKSDAVTLTLTINNAAFASGYRFGSVLWIEGGDYQRTNAASTVSVSGSLSALSASNANTLTQSALAVDLPSLSVVGPNANWFAQAALDANSACSGVGCTNAFSSNAQTLMLTVSNSLSAQSSGLGQDAFIEKKLGAGQFTLLVTQVPEASTWAMMAAGLGFVGMAARRRHSAV